MVKKYMTDDNILYEVESFRPGIWVCMTAPTLEECTRISRYYQVDIGDLRAALDDEETSRVDAGEEYTLILFDIPSVEVRNEREAYTTIPLGLIIVRDTIISVCSEDTPILKYFRESTVRDFSTKKQVRFVFQIFWKSCTLYQTYLRTIDRKRVVIEEQISQNPENVELLDLHELESNLVYFDTSLRANKVVLERLIRYSRIKKYPEDEEILEDVVIENQQAIEMTQIYRDIIKGTRDLLSAVMDNRLNTAMKYLAAITIVMAIPDIVSGLYGMNVAQEWMPLSTTPFGFIIIILIIIMICLLTLRILRKRKML